MKIQKIFPTKFLDVKLFEVRCYNDRRGFFRETFNNEIQDLIGARTLSKSGMDLLSRVGVSKFMGLDIVAYLEAYSEFINPIFDNNIPNIDQKTPRIVLDF